MLPNPSKPLQRLAVSLLFTLLTGWHGWAAAGAPPGVTAGERSLLPALCADTLDVFREGGHATQSPHPRVARWQAKMGPGFNHMHHYCWGLINMRRALFTADRTKKEFLYKTAIADFMYVTANVPSGFILLPEIQTKIGEAAIEVQDYGIAETAFQAARQQKPDYWPAYTQWAAVQLKLGLKRDARELLEQADRYAPNVKQVQEMLIRAGGTPTAALPAASSPASAPTSEPASSATP